MSRLKVRIYSWLNENIQGLGEGEDLTAINRTLKMQADLLQSWAATCSKFASSVKQNIGPVTHHSMVIKSCSWYRTTHALNSLLIEIFPKNWFFDFFMKMTHWDNISGFWVKHPNRYLSAFSSGVYKYSSLEEAQVECFKRSGEIKIEFYFLVVITFEDIMAWASSWQT